MENEKENKENDPEKQTEHPKILASSRNFKFDPEWVQVLINLRMKYSKLFTRHRNSASDGWKLVFDELKESGAPDYVTMANIKKKWMNLMARYRQIKNSTVDHKNITWPYFEQINKGFGPKSLPKPGEESDRKSDSSLLNAVNNDERQNFIRKLIELRYNHRHLFTGKKYTARYGWMIIRTLLQCENRYTVEQLSKCWQNLVQRYKQLLRTENNGNITWPYFHLMHNWFNEDASYDETIKIEPCKLQNTIKIEKSEIISRTLEDIKPKMSREIFLERVKDQLNDIRVKQDLLHSEILRSLKQIEQIVEQKS